MQSLINTIARSDIFKSDLDYHLLRASMVLIFLLFGYSAPGNLAGLDVREDT